MPTTESQARRNLFAPPIRAAILTKRAYIVDCKGVFVLQVPDYLSPTGAKSRPDEALRIALDGLRLYHDKNFQAAARLFDEAIKLDPDRGALYNNRGVALSELGLLDRAIEDFSTAIRLKPTYASARVNLARALVGAGELDRAELELTRAVQIDPQSKIAHLNRARLARLRKEPHRALREIGKAIALDPNDARLYHERGMILSALELRDRALLDFDQAIALDQNHASALAARGETRSRLGAKKKAIADYNRALAINPDRADIHYGRARISQSVGDYKAALEGYRRAIEIDPKFHPARTARAELFDILGRDEEALEDYERALLIAPDSVRARIGRGGARFKGRDLDGAIADYSYLIRLDPKLWEPFFQRARVKRALGERQSAERDYLRAQRLHPLGAMIYNNRGIIQIEMGELDLAARLFRDAVSVRPNLAEPRYNLGITLYRMGKIDEANLAFDEFIRLAGRDRQALIARIARLACEEAAERIRRLEPIELDAHLASTRHERQFFKGSADEASLFIDIVNSTELIDKFGVYHFFFLLRKLEKMISINSLGRSSLYKKGLGDGFMTHFADPVNAVAVAVETLRDLDLWNRSSSRENRIHARVGIDYGHVKIGADDDRFGLPVIIAARLQSISADKISDSGKSAGAPLNFSDRIIISERARDAIKGGAFRAVAIGSASIKGLDGSRHRLYEVDWRDEQIPAAGCLAR